VIGANIVKFIDFSKVIVFRFDRDLGVSFIAEFVTIVIGEFFSKDPSPRIRHCGRIFKFLDLDCRILSLS